ncbi:hypothetical protein [Marinactinospora rubrisoli]|uniref:Uncharacterized protein n=1 Tax=Marinactinospora rubrisoli TaxID=2715399 RepID=A0ABW2KC26_9ACTN
MKRLIARGHFPRGLSQEAYSARTHIQSPRGGGRAAPRPAAPRHHRADPPGHPGKLIQDRYLRALDRVATEVAPEPGWRPVDRAPVPA